MLIDRVVGAHFLLMASLRVRGLSVDVLISCRRRRDHLLTVGFRLNLLLAIFVPRRVLALGNGHSGVSVALRRAVLLGRLSESEGTALAHAERPPQLRFRDRG